MPPSSPDVGPYRLLERIGAGGMGEVFLAERQGPRGFVKQVVVKRLLPHRELESEARASFFDEARLTAQLLHPNVVQVLELGEHDGRSFIAMEYLPGASVRGLMDALAATGERIEPALAGFICAQALHGLHHAHELAGPDGAPLGVVHRDISPENLLVGRAGEVKVVDFGLAKAFLASDQRRSGVIRGKAAYMPPEQLIGQPLDRRADVFATGGVLYELLVGSVPVSAHQVPAMSPLGEALLAVAQRALEKSPGDRYASAHEMAAAIEQTLLAHEARPSAAQAGELVRSLDAAGRLPRSTPVDAGAVTGALPEAPVRRARWPWAVGVLVVLAAVGWSVRPVEVVAPPAPVAPVVPPVEVVAAPVVEPEPEPQPPAPVVVKPVKAKPAPRRVSNGEVVLRANPWAEVFVDGKSLGTTPMAPVSLPAKEYVFVFRNEKLGTERRVSGVVKGGERVVVKANLLP